MNIFDPLISGSLSVSGSGHISGDLTVLGTISATISGTTSNAISASHAASYTLTSSFGAFTSSYTTGSFTGSFGGDGSNLTNIPSSGVTGLNLTRIADGSATASISNIDGLRVNTNTEITGALTISGSITLNGVPVGTGKLDEVVFNSYSSSNNTTNSLQNGRLDALEVSTSSLNTFTSSTTSRLNTIESTTGSLNTFTSSTNTILGVIETTTASLNTFTSSANGRLNSLETTSGSINTFTSSASGRLISLESASGSIRTDFNSYTSSNDTTNTTQNGRLNSLETTTSSLNSYTSSTDTRLGIIETTTGSLNSYTSSNNTIIGTLQTATSSLNSYTSSNTTNINAIHGTTSSLNTFTSSANGRLTSLESESSSIRSDFNSFTSSNNSVESTQNGRLSSLENVTGSYATTGSNIFQGGQTITGSLFISENLIVGGSSSINFISQSTLNIGTNIITVNAQNPSVRFGGLAVIDSGSSPTVSGSILFDSVKDEWLFIHKAIVGAPITSSIFLMGPETFNNVGNEGYLTLNRLPKGSGVEHLRDSNISDNGTTVTILSNAVVNGTFSATGTTLVSGSSQINHNSTTNYDGNQHVDHTTVSISAGSGLSGGGTIASTRTLTLDTGSVHFLDGVKKELNTEGVVSGSSQISFNGITDKPTLVSGSSQITYGLLTGIPSGIVSGSSQVSFGSITGVPSGLVSGSSQITYGSLSGIPSGIISGSSQVSFGSITGIPSGLVSGSSQITLTSLQVTTALTYTPYNATNPNGYTTNTGTVTSVGGTGTVSGLSLSGTVTSTGNLTLGGTLSVTPSNFSSQTANTFLVAPNGSAGTPTFRTIVAADVPTLNQNTTGTASNITSYTINQSVGTGNSPTFAGITVNGTVVASQSGFQSATYASGRNRIWSFGNADAYGLSYFQGSGGYGGSQDMIGFHFGAATVAGSKFTFVTDGSFIISGGIFPSANGTYNLGSSSARWNTLFTSDLSMSNGIGDYTIVEGEEDLFIYNNKTNKVFKFLLQEVDPSIVPPKKV